MEKTAVERFRELCQKQNGYDTEAYNFVCESLDYTLKHIVRPIDDINQHVTAHELLDGCRLYAIEQFGCLAKTVLNNWKIKTTKDIGDIVFQLVEYDLLGKQEEDRIEEFNNFYDFNAVFDLKPVVSYYPYYPEEGEWKVKYVQRRRKSKT